MIDSMLSPAIKRSSLPFSNQQTSASRVEAAAVFAVAEFERSRGGGLITRQPEEKLVYLIKTGYPLWLFPKNNSALVFDGLGNASHSISYLEMPSAKNFMESLAVNSVPREKYFAFLFDHSSFFQQSTKEKQFVLSGLIVDADFKSEFNVYREEATELSAQADVALFSPVLVESKISSLLSEFDKLQSALKEKAEKLVGCKILVNKTKSQYLTELDYEASASKEEADAKIRAQEELVNPKIAKLKKDYKLKIKNTTKTFDKEIGSLQKQKAKAVKSIKTRARKIKLYPHEAKAQAVQNHNACEKRWKEKIKKTQKELDELKKELKNVENDIKMMSRQKGEEISKLNFGLDTEVKFAQQPLLDLEAARDAKICVFKLETEKLLNLARPVLEDLDRSVEQQKGTWVNFEGLGFKDQELKNAALFYVPFYVACYENGSGRRFLIVPPSNIGSPDFSSKLRGAFGMSRIRDRLTPWFKTLTALIDKVQPLTKQNGMFESQLNGLAKKNNLLNDDSFMENVEKGLVTLRSEGWLSDKEKQVLSNRLTVQR